MEKDFWDLDILIEIPESSGAAGSGEESSGESLVSWGLGILKDAFGPRPQAGMRLTVSLGPRVMMKNAQAWFVELSMALGSSFLTCQLPPHPLDLQPLSADGSDTLANRALACTFLTAQLTRAMRKQLLLGHACFWPPAYCKASFTASAFGMKPTLTRTPTVWMTSTTPSDKQDKM